MGACTALDSTRVDVCYFHYNRDYKYHKAVTMKYIVKLGISQKEYTVDTEMPTRDVLLLIVEHFGEEWYGCKVTDANGRCTEILNKDLYNISHPNQSVYECALSMHNLSARICNPCNDEDAQSAVENKNPFIKRGKENA